MYAILSFKVDAYINTLNPWRLQMKGFRVQACLLLLGFITQNTFSSL